MLRTLRAVQFSRLRRGKSPLEEQEVVCSKTCFTMQTTHLAIRQNANTFCPQRASFRPEPFGMKEYPLPGNSSALKHT